MKTEGPLAPPLDSSEPASQRSHSARLGKAILVGFILALVIGGVYAGFVATQTFSFGSSSSPIANKSYTINFLANVNSPTLIGCGTAPAACFTVTGTVPVTVSASSTVPTGSGVTIDLIQILPLTSTCSSSMPTVLTGLIIVPNPGNAPASITLAGATDYQYCIYYQSAASISSGSFSVTFQG